MLGGDPIRGHVETMILGALRAGPTHGYGLIVRLRELSDGAFDLKEGTVYPALHRLERDGKLASDWSQETGRKRRVYALTPAGETALSSEREAWVAFARGMSGVLGGAT
ncbi:MAG: PadR family transcriptional regulator, regulatory protein PadR [Gaiellales bacterium]|jgi:DNA-binding PadR family transcriptional regulator|nr:PadR family transcriptional regulator, regulatory protein PadR [Gaiellales bacterium]MDX6596407.1 PadR family transcriptional regulator, regulatory protein PadR [Gaiellales bacterium]